MGGDWGKHTHADVVVVVGECEAHTHCLTPRCWIHNTHMLRRKSHRDALATTTPKQYDRLSGETVKRIVRLAVLLLGSIVQFHLEIKISPIQMM